MLMSAACGVGKSGRSTQGPSLQESFDVRREAFPSRTRARKSVGKDGRRMQTWLALRGAVTLSCVETSVFVVSHCGLRWTDGGHPEKPNRVNLSARRC